MRRALATGMNTHCTLVVMFFIFIGLPLTAQASGTEPHTHDTNHAQHDSTASSSNGGQLKPLDEGVRALKGVAIYRRDCLACHGKSGAGDGPKVIKLSVLVPNFTLAEAIVDLPQDKMVRSLKDGHKSGAAFGPLPSLSQQEIEDVVKYIQDAFMLPAYVSDASIGRQIYARTCSVCHGDKGNAASWAQNSLDPAPFDFTSYKAKKLSRRHMINTVTYGTDNTAMVGWATQLTKEERSAVVDYVRGTFIFPGETLAIGDGNDNHSHGEQGHNGNEFDMTRPYANGLTGDLERGKAIFQFSCAPCHGKEGNGDGPRAYFIFPKPENLISKRARAELNRPHLFSSISDGVLGTVMPAWSQVLTDQDITDTAEYVFKTFIMGEKTESSAKVLNQSDHEQNTQKKTVHQH